MKISKTFNSKKILFDFYADNLRRFVHIKNSKMGVRENNKIREVIEPVYICPLCLDAFNEFAIQGSDSLLTLEHNPPRSLKGHARILTCKPCNNNYGTKSDSLLQQHILKEPFLKGKPNSFIDCRFTINNYPIKGKVHLFEGNKMIFHINEKSNPHHSKQILEYIKQPSGEAKFTFSTPRVSEYKRSILKTAYLEMFALFGYCFVFDVNSSKLREAIKNKDSKIPINVIGDEVPIENVGLNFIKSPPDISNYLVVLPFKTKHFQRNVGVIIPQSDQHGWDHYLNWNSKKGILTTEFTHFKNYSGIINSQESIFEYYHIPLHTTTEVI
jgi:hypothetical protein